MGFNRCHFNWQLALNVAFRIITWNLLGMKVEKDTVKDFLAWHNFPNINKISMFILSYFFESNRIKNLNILTKLKNFLTIWKPTGERITINTWGVYYYNQ